MSLWLPLAVILSTGGLGDGEDAWLRCFRVFATVACWSAASILANDLTDVQIDRASGKERWILRFSLRWSVALVALLYGLGALNSGLADGAGALGAYLAAAALGLCYSVRPVRLKTRGLLGPLAYSSSSMFAFVVVPWAWMGSHWPALAVLAPAVLLDKWVNLHFHQVVDCESDRRNGVLTYCVAVGVERGRRSLKWAVLLASVWLLGTLIFVALSLTSWRLAVAGSGAVVVLAVGLYSRLVRRSESASALLRELHWTYLGLTYVLFRLVPLLLLARLSLREPAMWSVSGVVALLVLVESWHSFRYRCDGRG